MPKKGWGYAPVWVVLEDVSEQILAIGGQPEDLSELARRQSGLIHYQSRLLLGL